MTAETLLRAARRLGLKARIVTSTWRKPGATPLPSVAECKDGCFIPVGGIRKRRPPAREPAKAAGRAGFEARG